MKRAPPHAIDKRISRPSFVGSSILVAYKVMGARRTDVDVIVIGGGVNGTGVARDCALRGISVALFEKNDVGFGASGNSSGMIHGGPRYLTKNPQVTYTSCLDSGHIQRVAPHLLFRVPFLVPVFGPKWQARAQLATYDAFFEVYDRYQYLKRGQKHLRFDADQVAQLEPSLVPTAGGVSFDEWGIDGVRLCVASLKDAAERGAQVFNHTQVIELLRGEAHEVLGVKYKNALTQERGTLTSRLVINATGAWAPITAALGGLPATAARLRPGKGVHVFLDRRLSNFAVVTRAVDGRQVFLLPWQNMSVLGTTDDDFFGDLDDVVATSEEVRYLRQAIEKVVPAVTHARAIGTWGGVRPTLYEWGQPEDALSRDHKIVDHAPDRASGLFSMLGGKLASYRLFAEEMTDVVARQLHVDARCQSHELALPGGEMTEAVRPDSIDPLSWSRLKYRHGSRVARVLRAGSSRTVCLCEPVVEAEVRYCLREEWAESVEDVSRRTRLGLGSCGGMRCAATCARIIAEERELSPEQARSLASDFLSRSLARRLPAVGPEQAKQELLSAAHFRAQMGWEFQT